MIKLRELDKDIQNQMIYDRKSGWVNSFRFPDDMAIRRLDIDKDKPTIIRPNFVRDIEKILHLPHYNRYSDKTQVFSFYLNDDITRRSLHVQLVSRIARNIGAALGLNLDLIEAISLGHDIGHTPFGHAGERYLSEILNNNTGRFFNHNVHSVRVLDTIFKRNITLQTLDGIICHNGEYELDKILPNKNISFDLLDDYISKCNFIGKVAVESLIPSTLEGCVVRISDIIAYLGKDRQDAQITNIINEKCDFVFNGIGVVNANIINNITIDIVENSYRKDYIELSDDVYKALRDAKNENYKFIYNNSEVNDVYDNCIKPMFKLMYSKLLDDLLCKDENTVIYKHHIDYIFNHTKFYGKFDYLDQDVNDIVVDYIASMTDDYFLSLFDYLFPDSKYKIEYKSYFA